MKILVTGGFGFIGSKIVEMLSNEKHDVRVMDNSETYGVITKENLDKLYAYRQQNWKKVHRHGGDVSNRNDVLKAFHSRPDIVIHLASYPRAKIVNANPMLGTRNIVEGTVNLLWHCDKMRVKKFVFISSSMIYGHFTDGTKEDSDSKPNNLYGESKLVAERFTKHYHTHYGVEYNIVRPSGVYGPGDMDDRVLSKFFAKAIANEKIEVHDGSNKVDFTYIDDTAKGIIKVALGIENNMSFNITAGHAITLRDAAERIIALTGSKSKIVDTGMNKIYPRRGTLDITRAKNMLGYKPEVDFNEGLKRYYEWLQHKI
jgi:nucleoside-diphosphate-sugar epimerase|tara:strand:+ start:42 stop:986 length:945 start_codon:yes stop_codon:yes gene_type:complete